MHSAFTSGWLHITDSDLLLTNKGIQSSAPSVIPLELVICAERGIVLDELDTVLSPVVIIVRLRVPPVQPSDFAASLGPDPAVAFRTGSLASDPAPVRLETGEVGDEV